MTGDDGRGGRPRGPRDDVAAELAALRRGLRETDDIAREAAAVLSETAPKVDDLAGLADQVAALTTALEAAGLLDDTPAEDPALAAAKAELGMRGDPPGPWCWPLLTAAQADAAWDALARWVDLVLVPTYEITRAQLLDCWPRHPRTVAELSGLRLSYLEAHARRAPARLAADWHTRQLPATLADLAALAWPPGRDHDREPVCGPGFHLTGPDAATDSVYEFRDLARQPATIEHWGPALREARIADLDGRRGPGLHVVNDH